MSLRRLVCTMRYLNIFVFGARVLPEFVRHVVEAGGRQRDGHRRVAR